MLKLFKGQSHASWRDKAIRQWTIVYRPKIRTAIKFLKFSETVAMQKIARNSIILRSRTDNDAAPAPGRKMMLLP
jgi:hypothetical protein